MDEMAIRVVAILLNETDHMLDRHLIDLYVEKFDSTTSRETLKRCIYQLDKVGVIYELDPESDIFDLASVDHTEQGYLKDTDYSIELGLTYLSLGAKALVFVDKYKREISDACRYGGFENALTHIENISFDSTTWTGLPKNFRMDRGRKESLVVLLKEAQRRLEDEGSNFGPSQAKALVGSAIVLAEAPDPPADLIFANIQRASAITGLAEIFVKIIRFFLGAPSA